MLAQIQQFPCLLNNWLLICAALINLVLLIAHLYTAACCYQQRETVKLAREGAWLHLGLAFLNGLSFLALLFVRCY